MKKTIHWVVISLLFSIFSSCKESIFTAEIEEIEEPKTTIELSVEKIESDNLYYPYFAVYDSLLISSYPNSKEYMFYISDINKNKELGAFMHGGSGPDEYPALYPIRSLNRKGNDLVALTYDPFHKQIIELNITQSLSLGRDSVLYVGNYEEPNNAGKSYIGINKLGESKYVGYFPGLVVDVEQEKYLPSYCFFDGNGNSPTKKISIFKDIRSNKISDDRFIGSVGSLSPDNTKIVDVMYWLDQINIIELVSNSVHSYRIKGSPDERIFKSDIESSPLRYQDVVCNDSSIYALYSGLPLGSSPAEGGCYYIHEFDWDGNFKNRYHFQVPLLTLWLDPTSDTLYGYCLSEDALYKLLK